MRRYVGAVALLLMFAAHMTYLFSSASISALFAPDLVFAVLESPDVRRAVAQEIVSLVEVPAGLEEPLRESLYHVLSGDAVKPAIREALPALRSYLESYGRTGAGVWLDIAVAKRELVKHLEQTSSGLAGEVSSGLPDRIDVSDYLFAVLPKEAYQAYRMVETMPRVALVLTVALAFVYLVPREFGRTSLRRAALTLGLSSLLTASLGCALPETAKGRLLMRFVSQLPLPAAISSSVIQDGPRLMTTQVAVAAVPSISVSAALCLLTLPGLSKAALRKKFRETRRGSKTMPPAGVLPCQPVANPLVTLRVRGRLSGWVSEQVEPLRERAHGFEKERFTEEYRKTSARLRKLSLAGHAGIYLLLLASVPLFFSTRFLSPFPPYGFDVLDSVVTPYEGNLDFSGERAYEHLAEFLRDNPDRRAGTEGGVRSALWVRERFEEAGLLTGVQEFDFVVKAPRSALDRRSSVWTTVGDLVVHVSGMNVVATSPGEVSDVILIGAHRDTAGRYPGAEDNGSGTATMLELACVLASRDHFYTYVFVSFDAEEAGLKGSQAFLEMNRSLPVRLAVILDMTGFEGADSVGFYPPVSRTQQAPLWTLALAGKVLSSPPFELRPVHWDTTVPGTDSSVLLFWYARTKNTSGRIPTDSEPFVNAGIPAIGIMAAKKNAPANSLHGRVIHSDEDTIEQISSDALALTGRFVEHYLATLESTARTHIATSQETAVSPAALMGKGELASCRYVLTENAILPPKYVQAFSVYVLSLALGSAALTLCSGRLDLRLGGRFFLMETPWLAGAAAFAWAAAVIPRFLASGAASSWPFAAVHGLWFLASAGGAALLVFLRSRFLRQAAMPYSWVTLYQRMLLNCASCVLLAAMIASFNPFLALETMLLPVFFFGRINHERDEIRILWTLALGFWLLTKFIGSGNWLKGFVYDPGAMPGTGLLFLGTLSWMITALYVVSTPPPAAASARQVTSCRGRPAERKE